MSRLNGTISRMQVAAIIAIVAGMGCSDASSNNWNNMFGRNDDRRVEPRGNDAPAANRPRPGATAAKPETASNDYVAPEKAGDTGANDRGDPAAIEQYAANVNPPTNGGPRIQSNRPIAENPNPDRNSPPMGAPDSNRNSGNAPSMSENGASPVRMAADRPANGAITQPMAQPQNATPRQPASSSNNTMFLNSSNASGSTPQTDGGGRSLPTVEDRASQPQPINSQPRDAGDATNGAPVISRVTAQPDEQSPSRLEGAIRSSNNDLASNVSTSSPPPKDDAAERRQREITSQEAIVAKDPANIEEQFKLRTMYLFEGRDEEALEPIRGVTPDVQEIMLAQLRSLQAARSGTGRDPATWANRQLEAMRVLQNKLRAKADLQVPKVELCTEIRQFGVYTPFPSSDFKAGVPNDVLIYVEVDNFESQVATSGEYRTLLSARLTLMSDDGRELVSLDEPNIEDFSRGVRRDFFLAFGPITIPGTLPAGEYVVKVYIEDKLAGKINSNKTSLRLVP